jgi:hypothetical protein
MNVIVSNDILKFLIHLISSNARFSNRLNRIAEKLNYDSIKIRAANLTGDWWIMYKINL